MANLTFLGGTDTVTGSKFLLTAGGRSLLVDCGMFQGPREISQLNWQDPPFAASWLQQMWLKRKRAK